MKKIMIVIACAFAGIAYAEVTIVDVTGLSASTLTGSANGATFTVFDFSSAGTGVMDPFLRINNDNVATTCGANNSTRECGYNTNGTVDPNTDTKTDPHTHALLMANYQGSFILDLNEPGGSKQNISIDQLQVYGANLADVNVGSTAVPPAPFPAGTLVNPNLTLLWSLDEPSENTDYTIFARDNFSGSGSTDLKIDIPTSLFYQSASGFSYLVLFANLGNVDSLTASGDSDGGFEEFASVKQSTSVPDGGMTLMLLGGALVGLEALRRRFRA